MLISSGQIINENTKCEVLSAPNRTIFWRGFVYKPGCRAGAESFRELAEAPEEDIPRIAAQLRGAYFVALQCEVSGRAYAFVDHSGLYHAYHSRRLIGTSFLEICRLEGCSASQMDADALVEFFHCGYIYEDKTLFRDIRKVGPATVLRSDSSGIVDALPKPIRDISEPTPRTFDSLIQDFILAVQNERVSVDITGGADSRLLAAALAYFDLPFEMATSGRAGVPDFEIGAKVAEALDRPFFPTYHSADRSDWDALFFLNEGLFDVMKNSRFVQLLQDRKSRGVTLAVSGVCGEIFTDCFWMQDFPLYAGRKPRIERYFSMRMHPNAFDHELLVDPYRQCSYGLRKRLLQRVSRFAVPSNTRSYDRFYYYFQLPPYAGGFVTSGANFVKVAAPYVDQEVSSIGFNLPPRKRILSRFHRGQITRYSPKAARLPSTEGGATLRSGAAAMSANMGKFLADRAERLRIKLGQRFLAKGLKAPADDPKSVEELVRTMRHRRSTEVLADCGVIRAAIEPRSLPESYLGRVFVLGRIFEELENSDRAAENIRLRDYDTARQQNVVSEA